MDKSLAYENNSASSEKPTTDNEMNQEVRFEELRHAVRRIVERTLFKKGQQKIIRASDLEQIAWKSILRNQQLISSYSFDHILAWVTKLVQNRMIDQIRRNKVQVVSNESLDLLHSKSVDPCKIVEANDLKEYLVDNLSPVYSQIITLREEGHDLNTISSRLNLPKRTAQRMIHRLSQRARLWVEK